LPLAAGSRTIRAVNVLGPRNGAFPRGVSEYRKLRRMGHVFVDKTAFIADVLDSGADTLLFTPPRRFGKTLNLHMLRDFLERGTDDMTDVFEDTEIWRIPGNFRQITSERMVRPINEYENSLHHIWLGGHFQRADQARSARFRATRPISQAP
jgi:hypothetical protein